ncbi:aldose 1-epimerase [Robiginitomaculum antarcticum]|uniref:aldose 1-epimerase n=1 Tax=Robiginitomaculum antarcticum TaxID=437507 RepID=UPI0003729C4B|nr:aldose 1-epimerase [Robiginitomaculum antarcticum]
MVENANRVNTTANELDTFVLMRGDTELVIRPALGGAIQSLRWRKQDILRSGSKQETDIVQMASFPMVPVVNRIPDGKFTFEGRSVELAPNLPGTSDFIHGFGWKRSWSIEMQGESEAVLKLEYESGLWPWAFEAHQKFKLENNGLFTELSVTNRSETHMPAALGFHPYFPMTSSTRLKAQYDGYWGNNDRQHAVQKVSGSTRKDFTVGADLVDTEFLDTSHYNWLDRAILTEPGCPTVSITASHKAKHLHVFYQPGGDFVAIEPTSGRSNMFGVPPQDYEILAPRETFSIWMKIEVE